MDIQGSKFFTPWISRGQSETGTEAGIFTPWIATGVGGKMEKTRSFSNKKDFVAKFFSFTTGNGIFMTFYGIFRR